MLISKGDVSKISDFGTSREWNEKSTKMSFAGTVAWMAPEVIRNEPCSEKVDIWCVSLVVRLLETGLIYMECIVHGSKNQNDSNFKLTWERVC